MLRQFNAVPAQYLSTSPVRDDATNNRLTQQVPNPFGGCCRTGLTGANVARSQLLRPYPAVHGSVQAETETNGESDYQALQARRAAHGEWFHRYRSRTAGRGR